jgi:hypothetical protein
MGNRIFCTPQNSISRQQSRVCDGVSYIVLRGRWCNIIVLNVHAPSKEKSYDSKDNFYEELEQAFFYHFLKYRMKSLLGDFNAIIWKREYFKTRQFEMRVYISIVMIMVLI